MYAPTILISILSCNALAEGKCFRLFIKDQIDEVQCKPVKVSVSVVNCESPTTVITDNGEFTGALDCKSNPMHMKVPHEGGFLISTIKKSELWGQANYQVVETKFEEGPAIVVERREIASVVEPVEPPAPVVHAPKTAKKSKQKRQVARILETPITLLKEKAPAPQPVVLDAPKAPAEKALEKKSEVSVKVSGMAWIETEATKNFGYDGAPPAGSGGTNFSSSAPNSQQNFSSFFSLLQLDVAKGPTQLTSVFEIGELIGGEATTGGSQGGGQKAVEVRNLYLTHNFDSNYSLKAGLQPLASDPNGFIISDHYSSGIFAYQSELFSTSLWTADAFASKPGMSKDSTGYVAPDRFFGFIAMAKPVDSFKDTLYGVNRSHTESLFDEESASVITGKSQSQWLGNTANWNFWGDMGVEGTYIYNRNTFAGESNGPKEAYDANLVDVKLTNSWKDQKVDVLLESLATSGSSGSVASGQTVASIGKRKSYSAPDPGAAYMFTIATSDGVDEAPGSKKESIIGNLSQLEGMQASVFKISKGIGSKFTGFFRYGILKSAAKNADTQSNDMGQEWDIQGSYELSPGTLLQVDYGEFTPGAYYANRDKASLFTTRLKFSF